MNLLINELFACFYDKLCHRSPILFQERLWNIKISGAIRIPKLNVISNHNGMSAYIRNI